MTVTVILRKSDKPVSTTHELWKYFGLCVKMRSMQDVFSGFLYTSIQPGPQGLK